MKGYKPNMNNIFNFLDTSLNKLDKTVHNTIKDTFVDNFIHELQDYLQKCHSYELFKQLPRVHLLSFNWT